MIALFILEFGIMSMLSYFSGTFFYAKRLNRKVMLEVTSNYLKNYFESLPYNSSLLAPNADGGGAPITSDILQNAIFDTQFVNNINRLFPGFYQESKYYIYNEYSHDGKTIKLGKIVLKYNGGRPYVTYFVKNKL